MVVVVIEKEGGPPLTNEIKIFKHCFTILPGPSHHYFAGNAASVAEWRGV